jgi:hypothetical protein
MSLNISETPKASSQLGSARSPVQSYAMRRPSGQAPEGADAAPKPRSLAENPENATMRAHPAASTDDSLQRLPESHEPGRNRSRVRRNSPPSEESGEPRETARKARSPYDPPAHSRRHIDILA